MSFSLLFSYPFIAGPAQAGEFIVLGGEIYKIASTNGNRDEFTVWVRGGTGPCADSGITFPAETAGNLRVHDRTYAAALMAFASKKKVDIHDYTGASCSNAEYIRVYD